MTISTHNSDNITSTVSLFRRFAAAMAGNQTVADRYLRDILVTLSEEKNPTNGDAETRTVLFQSFLHRWMRDGGQTSEPDNHLVERAQGALASLDVQSRAALLLHVLAGFDFATVAEVQGTSKQKAQEAIFTARRKVAAAAQSKVLIVEDEIFLAMDISDIVNEMGHRIIGPADTATSAVELAEREQPDLILADIALAGRSTGFDAVKTIRDTVGSVPVIFITAFPDRVPPDALKEPACVIGKPYTEEQLRSVVSEAIFFGGTYTLTTAEEITVPPPNAPVPR